MTDTPEPQNINIRMPESMMGGVWANFAGVTASPHEFTIDFMRLDQVTQQGIVVARVNVSPLFITELMTLLERQWQAYAEKAMPREVRGDGEGREQG